MTQPVTEADAIANDGTTVHLYDGTAVQLRYTMASLRALEARYGSIEDTAKAFDALLDGDSELGAIFTDLTDLIAPGLLHVRITDPDTGRIVKLGADLDLCAENLDVGRLAEYLTAVSRCLRQAFFALDSGSGKADPTEPPSTAATPGPTGTTSPPSPSGDPTRRSGA